MPPFFSIIIPAYNRAYMIAKTIGSVIDQRFTDWECIVVDDGSTDNTREVVSGIQDDRVKYVYQKNAERSAARNNGIRNATGRYICFLDSDDFFESSHLQTLYDHIQKNEFPVAMFFVHAYHYINDVKTEPEMVSLSGDPMLYFFTQPVIPARVCMHREILQAVRYDEDIVIVEDLVLWVKVAFSFPVFEIKERTVRYTLHEDNSVNLKNNSYLTRYNGLKVFFKRYPEVIRKIPKALRWKIMSNTVFGMARFYNFKNNYWKMVAYLWLSIWYAPIHEQTKAKIHMMIFPRKHK